MLNELLAQLNEQPDTVEFQQVMNTISEHYDYTPARFTNGDTINEAGSNEGSCKIFAFAQLNALSEAQTLACFGQYYRDDVLNNPQGDDHANIRNFMQHGWGGIAFDTPALQAR